MLGAATANVGGFAAISSLVHATVIVTSHLHLLLLLPLLLLRYPHDFWIFPFHVACLDATIPPAAAFAAAVSAAAAAAAGTGLGAAPVMGVVWGVVGISQCVCWMLRG